MAIEHQPHKGRKYLEGIQGQKVAIVGYSHWIGAGSKDGGDVTEEILAEVLSGELRIAFFTAIASYFEFRPAPAFWERVLFFNFLPSSVGGPSDRYRAGEQQEIERGQQRFLTLIRKYMPQKVLIITMRGWSQLPKTEQEESGDACFSLCGFPEFQWGTYEKGQVKAFGLRHPQGASGSLMRSAVKTIIEM